VNIAGRETNLLTVEEKSTLRLNEFGYVFQEYALLPELTAVENASVPLLMQGLTQKDAERKAREALERVGLAHRLDKLPSQLSGGEQQRVSISRAIAHQPKILFADEPTANLDRKSSAVIMDIFKKLHHEGQTIVMVTHEEEYARETQHTVYIDEGMIVSKPVV
jgi:putative ABC transport system ATP-binding protein